MIKMLLIAVFALAIDVPFFNRAAPALFGFPFFYWYQLAVVLAASLLTWAVYLVEGAGKEGDE